MCESVCVDRGARPGKGGGRGGGCCVDNRGVRPDCVFQERVEDLELRAHFVEVSRLDKHRTKKREKESGRFKGRDVDDGFGFGGGKGLLERDFPRWLFGPFGWVVTGFWGGMVRGHNTGG
jgi:hypothetical protein